MEKINYEEKCKEMAHKFWNNIFNRKWHNCNDFEVNVVCNHYDKEDIETTFEICKLIAYSQCNKSS